MLGIFVKDKEIKRVLAQVEELKDSKKKAQEELEELKMKKRIEIEEIKHLTKINESRMKHEVEGKKIELERDHSKMITKFKEEQRVELVDSLKGFHSKIEGRFNDELKNLKEVYGLLMQRLPNVNVELTKRIK